MDEITQHTSRMDLQPVKRVRSIVDEVSMIDYCTAVINNVTDGRV